MNPVIRCSDCSARQPRHRKQHRPRRQLPWKTGGWPDGGTRDEDEFALLAALFRRGVVFASLIMVLSMGWGWMQGRSENTGETALANYAMNIQLPP